ncbi:tRNA lysidine(34) synthetase TilS [uncultured Alsobacter sp.]|uniref:tRNA lysidine(34) synthetase TilS n=1 Tax=uncultured Alsobacter sp. TaxID=1748258 RepID=UPI0025DC7F8F|nr:tRNA lysidine(34) synthetase TilS [uncultured Alsobacter sp.]
MAEEPAPTPHGRAATALVAAFAGLETVPALVLAVSGGADSMALLCAAALWAKSGTGPRPLLHVATVDHGLRPDAAREAEQVAAWSAMQGLPHATLAWTGPKPSTGLQAAAREARYALLEEYAVSVGATHVLTAHHATDQAETVLMRLMRGSGPTGLAAMQACRALGRVTLARPFIGLAKADLVAFLRSSGQEWIEDPSNIDPRFARTAVRRGMPLLAAGGLTEERLARLAARLARLDEVASAAAATATARDVRRTGDTCRIAPDLFGEPAETRVRVLAAALQATAGSPMPPRLERVERLAGVLSTAFAEGRAVTRTAAGCIVRLRRGEVTIVREGERARGRSARSRPAKNELVV